MAGRAVRRGGDDSRCPACRAPLLTQWVGDRAALKAVVDPTAPLTPDEQAAARGPNRLIWCLYKPHPQAPARLRWIHRGHPATCPHPHVADHHCPGPRPAGPQPDTLF
ncbi:hypothetical protein [Streptomyces sp. DH12]|uniref:hypothetical protein n=1 Tax=Streptomyces sp. DH12 TaxID=2857010 RepID=UPI001E5A913A|nr:hypothetical protein [Streptomyces sp. DH12]